VKIALDYDKCYNLDRTFWNKVVDVANDLGHEVRIVTYRSPTDDTLSKEQVREDIPIIYTDGVAKRFHCKWFVDKKSRTEVGWNPDVWIDDRPEVVDNNSVATIEILEKWRNSEEYSK